MTKIKEHIIFKTTTLLLAILLLVPTVVKFAHIFSHHKHDICYGKKTTHLHEINTDCDLHKFKLSHSYTIVLFNFEFFYPKEKRFEIISQYQFLSKFQRLQTSLRGPPALV